MRYFFFKIPYASKVQGVNVSKKGDKFRSQSVAVKSGYSKLLEEMNCSKTLVPKTSLKGASGQISNKAKNAYDLMLSEVLPGKGALKIPDTAKRPSGVGVKTRLKPAITPA